MDKNTEKTITVALTAAIAVGSSVLFAASMYKAKKKAMKEQAARELSETTQMDEIDDMFKNTPIDQY